MALSEMPDMSREFTCFLCNGTIIQLGSVTLLPQGMKLCTAMGNMLEEFPYSSVTVIDEDPPTVHSLIITFENRAIYLFYIMRKEKLVRIFTKLNIFRADVKMATLMMGFASLTGLRELIDKAGTELTASGYSEEYISHYRHEGFNSTKTRASSNTNIKSTNYSTSQQEQRNPRNSTIVTNSTTRRKASSSNYTTSRDSHSNIHTVHSLKGTTFQHVQGGAGRVAKENSINSTRELTPPIPPRSTVKKSPRKPLTRKPSHEEVMGSLRALFPSESEDSLQNILEDVEYNMDKAVKAMVQKNNFANTLTPRGSAFNSTRASPSSSLGLPTRSSSSAISSIRSSGVESSLTGYSIASSGDGEVHRTGIDNSMENSVDRRSYNDKECTNISESLDTTSGISSRNEVQSSSVNNCSVVTDSRMLNQSIKASTGDFIQSNNSKSSGNRMGVVTDTGDNCETAASNGFHVSAGSDDSFNEEAVVGGARRDVVKEAVVGGAGELVQQVNGMDSIIGRSSDYSRQSSGGDFPIDLKYTSLQAAIRELPSVSIGSSSLLNLSQSPYNFHQVLNDRTMHFIRSMTRGDAIAGKCKQKLLDICRESGQEKMYPTLAITAGVVLIEGDRVVESVPVALGSGCKCLSTSPTHWNGQVLHDCHALVVARRAFLKFLYQQASHGFRNVDSIFTAGTSGKLKVRESLTFHLYVSTIPCGSARDLAKTNLPSSNNAPQLSSAEKTHPLSVKHHDILDARPTLSLPATTGQAVLSLNNGEPLLCMSCSDKLALWNTVGIQGALLSKLIEPVYFDSVTIGCSTEEGRTYGSLDHLHDLCNAMAPHISQPFVANQPKLFYADIYAERYSPKAPRNRGNVSMNWYCGTDRIEVLDPDVGKCVDGAESRLCKASLCKDYIELASLASIVLHQSVSWSNEACAYSQEKQSALDYQQLKNHFRSHWEQTGGGHWIKKPASLDAVIS